MFDVNDLSDRLLSELKEIAKRFDVDSKGLSKGDIIKQTMAAQKANPKLATKVYSDFSVKKEAGEGKRPRKVKLDPIIEETVQETETVAEEEEYSAPVSEVKESSATEENHDSSESGESTSESHSMSENHGMNENHG